MSNNRPNIGVTGPDKGGTAAWLFTKFAVFLQGGKAIRIRPKTGIPDENIHGLIIGGGADINPERYGKEDSNTFSDGDPGISGVRQFFIRLISVLFFPIVLLIRKWFSTKMYKIDDQRDKLEFDLLKMAIKKGIPILGICRGAQLINIFFGGTLYNDIGAFYREIPRIHSVWPKKKILVDQSSNLYKILAYHRGWVNGLHHQAVNLLGEELKTVAQEENGIIQAIEHENFDFILGVQWHPEYMPQIPPQRHIFKALVEEAGHFVNGGH